MRVLLDLVIGINAVAGILGFALRRHIKEKRLSHQDYISQLHRENAELDEEAKKLLG